MEYETRLYISIGFMILFAMIAMFFLGYKYAYDKAVNYANNQLEKIRMEEQVMNPDIILGNIELPRGWNNENKTTNRER